MGIDDINKRIINEAKEEALGIREEGELKAKQALDDAMKRGNSHREAIIKSATEKSERERQLILTPVRLKASREILEKKQNILEDLFRDALNQLSSLKDSEYKKILLDLLKYVHISGKVDVIPSFGRESITQEALKELKKDYEEKGKSFEFKMLKGVNKISGGAFIVGEKIDIDLSFETLIKSIREGIEPTLVEILFGTEVK